MSGRAGYASICAGLSVLPATPAKVAEATGYGQDIAEKWLRNLHRMGILRIASRDQVAPKVYVDTFDWAGDGKPSLPAKRQPPKRAVPPILLINLAAMLRELSMGCTVTELAEVSGLCRRSAAEVVTLMREHRLLRIVRWEWCRTVWAPVYQRAKGKDAPRPEKEPRKVLNARAWARRRERLNVRAMHSALTAPVETREAA